MENIGNGVRTGGGFEADHDGGAIEIDQRGQIVLVPYSGIDPKTDALPGKFAIELHVGLFPRDGIKVGEVKLPQVK